MVTIQLVHSKLQISTECNCLAVLQVRSFWLWRYSKLCDRAKMDEDGVLLNSYEI